jgi:hypothetical protein
VSRGGEISIVIKIIAVAKLGEMRGNTGAFSGAEWIRGREIQALKEVSPFFLFVPPIAGDDVFYAGTWPYHPELGVVRIVGVAPS